MKVAVHNGAFHADDAFSIAILKKIHPDLIVIRTRDPELLESCDLRVDVGKVYDPKTGDFDHHQKVGAGIRENGIPYAACGLIWKEFSTKIVDKEVADRIEKKLIQTIDAGDNGLLTYTVDTAAPFTIHDVIESMVPDWKSDESNDSAFMRAVDLATIILDNVIRQSVGIIAANTELRNIISDSEDLVVLESFMPWKKILVEESNAKFIVYPSSNGSWCVHIVPVKADSFEARKDLPKDWAGLEGADFVKITGVEDAIFCHRNVFIAGAKTKEGALKLAKLALEK